MPIRSVVAMICLIGALVSMATLWLGWLGGNDLLIRVSPNFQAIVPTTALSFALLTIALMFEGLRKSWADRLAVGFVWAIVGLVVVNMVTRIFVHPDGLDSFLPIWTDLGDRMSYATAALLLLAAALVFHTARARQDPPLSLLGGALLGITTTGSIAMSHGLDVTSPYRLAICDGISLYSLSLFALVFTALLLIQLTASDATDVPADPH